MSYKDWVARIADQLEAAHSEGKITLASGLSPSGHIHLGNLREVITGHFVADELRQRGRNVRHILSWDDFDRLRRVPEVEGVDSSWEQYVGFPLSSVPAPNGSEYVSWAEHFKAEFRNAMQQMGIVCDEISQTEMYLSGQYHDSIVTAMNSRVQIGEILREFQTKGTPLIPENYYPFKAYCASCGTDTTTVTSWNGSDETLSYTCTCGESFENVPLNDVIGKLVWKVDWPMRWAYESVNFEPAGVDHMSPGSSWDAGEKIVQVFGGTRPQGQVYSFVGIEGAAKMSSSKGFVPTPGLVLPSLGPGILRWLYVRQFPNKSFTIDMTRNTARLYDEWDALSRRVRNGKANEGEAVGYRRAIGTHNGGDFGAPTEGELSTKFSALTSFAEITFGNLSQVLEMSQESSRNELNIEEVSVRAERAINWVEHFLPENQRLAIRNNFNEVYFNTMTPEHQEVIHDMVNGLEDAMNGGSDELTRWVFGAAKLHFGYDLDERNLSADAKFFQREYFANLYQLLISDDHGPRIPSLISYAGFERTKNLLRPDSGN